MDKNVIGKCIKKDSYRVVIPYESDQNDIYGGFVLNTERSQDYQDEKDLNLYKDIRQYSDDPYR